MVKIPMPLPPRRPIGALLAATLVAVSSLLGASCATSATRSPVFQDLERGMKIRRTEGRRALERRIGALVRANALGDIRAFNPEAALAASKGKRKIASAAWWGWKRTDSTYALNEALSAPVDILIVPAMSGPWIVGPLAVNGPREILFEPGCSVIAAKGGFLGRIECLFSIVGQKGVTVSGYGARFAMRKSDYAAFPYEQGQWRHGIYIRECEDILIQGLTIERSGGDGVYVGQNRGRPVSVGITLRDLELTEHYRQGVSVIAGKGFRMEFCKVVGTRGTAPGAGIDFEPNSGVFGFVDCAVSGCVFARNAGAAFQVHLVKLRSPSPPVDIRVEDSAIIGSPLAIWARGLSSGAQGRVVLENCDIRGIRSIEKNRDVKVVIP